MSNRLPLIGLAVMLIGRLSKAHDSEERDPASTGEHGLMVRDPLETGFLAVLSNVGAWCASMNISLGTAKPCTGAARRAGVPRANIQPDDNSLRPSASGCLLRDPSIDDRLRTTI
jgi:hypothetical protein